MAAAREEAANALTAAELEWVEKAEAAEREAEAAAEEVRAKDMRAHLHGGNACSHVGRV